MAERMQISQPSVVQLEKSEAADTITLESLQRAAQALGCRVVYAFVPLRPLTETLEERALTAADRQLSFVEQTMRLEAQGVTNKAHRKQARQQLAKELLRRPARLWEKQ
jgi:predicted DNA-binding mobile mystery protein A